MNMQWLKAAGIRALRTIAQTATGMITVGVSIGEINWGYVASVSVVAGILSILTSIGGLPEVK